MRSTLRHAAAAFVVGVAIAIVFDVIVQLLSTSIRLTGGVRPAWWARAAAQSVWLVLGGLLWLAAPLIRGALEGLVPTGDASRRAIWAVVGTAFIALPPLYVAAQLIVLAIQLTLSGTWGSEARIFISGAYYGSVLLSITPWAAAGVILRASARHLASDELE
jgi:hypothetical protein